MEILPRDSLLESLLNEFLMNLLVPRGWVWALDSGETMLECCFGFFLALPELVEVVNLGKALKRIVNDMSRIYEDNTKETYRLEEELRG